MNCLSPLLLGLVLCSTSLAQLLLRGEPVVDKLVGGRTPADVDRKDVKDVTNFATASLSAAQNGPIDVIKVVKAETQVVSGVKFYLTVQIKSASCSSDCKIEQCELVVYQPRSGDKEMTQSECQPVPDPQEPAPRQPADPPKFGAPEGAGIEDDDVVKVANFAVDDHNEQSNAMYRSSLVKVESVTKQVVQGMLYTLSIRIGDSVCRNEPGHEGADLKTCPLSNAQKTKHCEVSVWFRAWLESPYVVNDFKCEPMEKAKNSKRSMLGGDDHDLCHYGMFRDFQDRHSKSYKSTEEEKKRFGIFCENMKTVREIQKNDQGTAKYGATVFADLTEKEFQAYISKPWDLKQMEGMKQASIPQAGFPEAFDWRDHGAVTPVKNQGTCGSCWAFSTTGNVEGIWFIHKKKLVSLSEQELVDCDKVDQGCAGGLPANAYKQIMKLGGLETESEYQYTGKNGKCHFIKSDVRAYINGSLAISSNEDDMAAWLAQNGPISIGINAFAMQFYMGGIAHPWKIFCNPKNLDHGVLIVGYGKKGNKPYWIIKNSWGPKWGVKGYYLIYRGSGACGLNTACTSSVVDN